MKELRQLAEAATPGPWNVDKDFPKKVMANDYCIALLHDYAEDNRDDTGAVNAAYIAAANPTAILALLDDLDQTNEMNTQLREQNTSLDKACAELEAANDAFAKRQEWWNNRMFELEVTIDALCKMLERDEAVLVNTAYWKSDLSRDISVHLEETE